MLGGGSSSQCSRVAREEKTAPAPSLPTVQKARLWSVSDYKAPNAGRNPWGGGEAIAPVVIADDPAPAAAAPSAVPGQAASGATLNGDANGITRESLNRAIQGAMGSLAACFSVPHPRSDGSRSPSRRIRAAGQASFASTAPRRTQSTASATWCKTFVSQASMARACKSTCRCPSTVPAPSRWQIRPSSSQPAAPPLFLEP